MEHGTWKHIGQEKRKDDRHLVVHMVPYTDTHLGFKKNADEYYSGANQMMDHASIKIILSSVTDELIRDPSRRFSFADVKYLNMWYQR